jgi:hypothetical protein
MDSWQWKREMSKEALKKKIVVNPEEAEVVRLIYRWYLTEMGAKSIAERLNREGYDYRGKPWSKNRVLDIIGEEAYIGRYYYNRRVHKTNRLKPREEWIEIPVEPIIDEATWHRAKSLKEQRTPSESVVNPAVFGSKTLLTGIALCGKCGARMSMETAKGGAFTYYNCANYLRRGKSTCAGQRIPAADLEKAILDHMVNRLFTKERVKAILRGVYTEIRKLDKAKDGQRKSLIRQLDIVKNKLTRQYEAIESGAIELRDVAERIRELKDQRALLEGQLVELKTHPAIPLHLFKDNSIDEFQKVIRDIFMGEDRIITKRYLKLFIEKIIINLPTIDITCKSSALLAALENKTAARRDELLTADINWLPRRNPVHNPFSFRNKLKPLYFNRLSI